MCDYGEEVDLTEFPAMGTLIKEFYKLVEERDDARREADRTAERVRQECESLKPLWAVQKEVTAPDIALAKLWGLLNAENQTIAVIALTALINGYRWPQAARNRDRIKELVAKCVDAAEVKASTRCSPFAIAAEEQKELDDAVTLAEIDLDIFLIEVFGK